MKAFPLAKVATPLVLAWFLVHAGANAQPVSLVVGKITTAQTCNYYMNSAGRAGAVANPWAIGVYASWRTWWQKECFSNFPTMRSTLESALASSETLRVGGRGARHTVVVNITNVGDPNGPAPEAPERDKFSIARSFVTVSMDVSVRDAGGRIVFGGLLTRRLELGSDSKIDGFEATNVQSGPAAYGRLQNDLGLAVARMVAFHFVPIQVTSTSGREVQLNYGAPLLQLGSLLLVSSPDRRTTLRYRVTVAAAGFSNATPDGQGEPLAITPGSIATYVDADDAQQNARRFQRVDLP